MAADLFALPFPDGDVTARERRARVDQVLELCGLTALRKASAGSLAIGSARMIGSGEPLWTLPPPHRLVGRANLGSRRRGRGRPAGIL